MPKLALNLGLSHVGAPYSKAARDLFARMDVQPNGTRKAAINGLIQALRNAGVWAKLDALYIWAAHDEQAAKLNWVADQYNATGVNSPTFVTDQGYTSDGSTSYLDTNFNAATAVGAKYTQNDAHMGVWIGSDAQSSTQIDCGNINARICARSSGNLASSRSNAAAGQTPDMGAANSTAVGHLMWSRANSSGYELNKNGGAAVAATQTSAALVSLKFFALCFTNTGGGALNFSTRQQRAFHFGGALSQSEREAFHAALADFFTV